VTREFGEAKTPEFGHVKSIYAHKEWDCWVDRDTGSQLFIFTIITTRANALVRRIHDRMQVIYDAAMGRQWLEYSGDQK
jgi:putative SOS response-associated peptidase YedK